MPTALTVSASQRAWSGVSPAWPFRYADIEPYYVRAEHLYNVHGSPGPGDGVAVDEFEPWRSAPYPYPALAHEPYVAETLRHHRDRVTDDPQSDWISPPHANVRGPGQYQ